MNVFTGIFSEYVIIEITSKHVAVIATSNHATTRWTVPALILDTTASIKSVSRHAAPLVCTL